MSIDEVKKYEFKCKVLGVEPLQINVCEEGIKTGRSKVDKDTIAITKFIDILGENTFSKK